MVADFGIARAMEDASLTATGSVVGTPFYMSPEQCAARRIGPQSDQYSIGVVAFQMLTGFVPFNAETLPGIMHHHFYSPVPDLSASRRGVPPALMTIINRALSKKADHRYATTDAMLAAVDAVTFTPEDQRKGEEDLRTLAGGGLLRRIDADPLPPLIDPTRGTPTGTAPVLRVPPKRRVDRRIAAAVGVLAIGALGWAGASLRGTSARVAAAPRAAGTRTESLTVPNGPLRNAAGRTAAASGTPKTATKRADSIASAIAAPTTAAIVPAVQAAPGLLRARAYPVDAELFVDGQSLGRGVVLDAAVPGGRRRLRVSAPGYSDFDTTITVASGRTTQLPKITLRPTESTP
jgi:hypothetical protein